MGGRAAGASAGGRGWVVFGATSATYLPSVLFLLLRGGRSGEVTPGCGAGGRAGRDRIGQDRTGRGRKRHGKVGSWWS